MELVIVALVTACAAAGCESSKFPEQLVPKGATLQSVRKQDEHCWAHQIATLDPRGADVAAWAAALDLPCISKAAPCTEWSTSGRPAPGEWKVKTVQPLNGVDTVTARLEAGRLVVDWGDYLCAGPN